MSDLRQALIRSLARNGIRPRLVVSNPEAASDWLLRAGPVAKRLNAESKLDGGGEAA